MKKIKLKKKTPIATILFLLSISLFYSCDKGRLFEQNQDIPESGWDIKNILKFDVEVKDPATPANFYVNVRNADGYPYGNLFLFIRTTFPNGKMSMDTLECVLADEKGQWLGNGLGDIYDNQIPFKKNVSFPLPGKYLFELQHGMRTNVVPLIMDVGLRIEKAE